MKTMLHKSFKPAKCKTSLRLATSRIKLMKNKKGVQINQMQRDLAQLLETGQDRTARIRVEHVIREEKMVAAYDLIEIYCELIVARLPIIESQKMCPTDLKEAVTSVIFAAPRCSDISELSDIRKHFTAKYGKEFVSAAIELRPDCGVSRLLVEKLSAVAPDVQTKIKVLSDVAKEHNIKWDPTSFEEKESNFPNDLLNGPANFEKANMTTADPPKVQASNINAHNHKEKHDAPFDFSQQNRKYTLGTQNSASTDTVGVETSSAATHADMRSSGITSERMEMRQPVSRGNNDFSSDRQNWNMEFKDATSAAQAAAESAERAAMAARAAAQFSSHEKIAKQYPTGSHVSDIRHETSNVSAPSGVIGEGRSRDSNKSSSDGRKPKTPSQQMDQSEHDTSQKATERFYEASHDGNTRSSRPTSFRSHNDSIEDEKLVNDFHMADGYFDESLNEDQRPSSPKTTTLEGFEESKAELGSGQKASFESEDINYFAEEATKKQPSIGSSHSSSVSDELDVPGHQKFTKTSVVGNPFAVVDQEILFREASKTSSNVDALRDDEAISDDDGGPRFDTGFEYDEVEANSCFLSPGRGSPPRSLENTHMWTPGRNNRNTVGQVSSQSHIFSESLSFPEHSVEYVGPSETDDHILANFDHSDGTDSESESELAKSSFSGIKEFNSRKTRIELNDLVERESSVDNPEDEEKRPESRQSSSLILKGHELKNDKGDQESIDTLEDNNNSLNQSNDLDTRKELNFGTLTGGLRNKGVLRYPPYTKSTTTDASYLSKKSVEESPITGGQTSLQSSLDSGVSRIEDRRPNVSMSSSDSDSDDYSNKYLVQSSEKASKQGNARSRYLPPAFFDVDGTDSEEEVTKQASSRVHLSSGLSRRTRGSSSKSHVQPDPEAKTIISSSSKDRKPSRYSEIPDEPPSYAGRSNKFPTKKTAETGSTEAQEKRSMHSYNNEAPCEPRVRSVNSKQEAVETMAEPKIPTREPIPRNTGESGKTKTTKTSNLVKEARHVHPKLPDYDSIAARLESLRTNRQ